MSMLQDFKAFAIKGNVIDLAVGVIIGAAFGKIVDSVVNDLIMPIVGSIFGGLDFSDHYLPLNHQPAGMPLAQAQKAGAVLAYGHFLTVLLNFLILAFVNASGTSPLALIARYDRYKPVDNLSDYSYHFFLGGLSYDISSRATLALDYQEQLPSAGAALPAQTSTGTAGIPPANLKTYFAHFVVNF